MDTDYTLLQHHTPECYDEAPKDIRVLTLNIAHGRGLAAHQLFLDRKRIERNLDAIAAVLRRESPSIVALQEADFRSAWNGSFDHVSFLAERASYAYSLHGSHMRRLGLNYGCAILSKFPLEEPRSVSYGASPLLPAKGFVSAIVPLGKRSLRVLSLHLDFATNRKRLKQVKAVSHFLRDHRGPLVVLGDLNAEWRQKKGAVRQLCSALDIQAAGVDGERVATFPSLGRRWDWVLYSNDFALREHRVLKERLSDHRAVCVDLQIDTEQEQCE